MNKPARGPAAALLAGVFLTGCASIQKMAVNRLGDFLAEGGSVYESDDDPDLVADALPFGLKLMESLLESSPDHPGLLRAACKGFTVYTYAYVDAEAERMEESDLDAARAMRARARRLYLRAWGYGERGLALAAKRAPAILADPRAAVAAMKEKDVPLLYWSAAALGLAISDSRGDAEMIARLPAVEALLDRARALDPDWGEGALDEFDIVLAGTRPGAPLDEERLRADYERALRLSEGKRASLFVGYAEQSAVKRQDPAEFRDLLDRALAIDPDAHTSIRLANLVAQRRARWLLDHVDSLFLDPDAGAAAAGAKPEKP
ncbi:MAG TPA: TRAP transporter TatT component family protein [Candidatus Polarisedimenticolia bacterium]|nr:TRAP transporter TatT component family protein [Candidatus Polarisedimenticolia bacterium]